VSQRLNRTQAVQEIDAAWLAIERSFDIESRIFFEAEAPKNGFGSPLAMAIHYLWKRKASEDDASMRSRELPGAERT